MAVVLIGAFLLASAYGMSSDERAEYLPPEKEYSTTTAAKVAAWLAVTGGVAFATFWVYFGYLLFQDMLQDAKKVPDPRTTWCSV